MSISSRALKGRSLGRDEDAVVVVVVVDDEAVDGVSRVSQPLSDAGVEWA
jgi:hypothetical protein